MATGVDSDRRKMALAVAVPRIVDQRPGAIQRRWPEVIRVPADDVAGGIADGAADAFDADIGLPALRAFGVDIDETLRSEEHTSELQSLMRISYAVFFLK